MSMNSWKRLRATQRGERGAVAIIFALSLIPLILAMGAGIDLIRAIQAKSALQSAVDSAVIAAAADDSLTQLQMEQLVRDYLNANGHLDDLLIWNSTTLVRDTTTGTISFGATGMVQTDFVRVVGVTQVAIGASAKAKIGSAGPAMIVFAVDITGSMSLPLVGGGTRISETKAAMNGLVDQIMGPPNQGARIGMVPFTQFVNLGGNGNIFTGSNFSPAGDLPENYIEPAGAVQSCFYPPRCYQRCPVDGVPDAGNCLIPNCPHPPVCNPVPGTGSVACASYRPIGFRDQVAFVPGQNRHIGVVAFCSSGSLFLNPDRTRVKSHIHGVHTLNTETWIPGGLLWAWHMLTPEAPLMAPARSIVEDRGGKRVLILLTDGASTRTPNPNHRGFFQPWPTTTVGRENPDALTLSLCRNIHMSGIELYTIFINDNSPANQAFKQVMEDCPANTSMAFNVSNRTDLRSAFNRIGLMVQKVTLTQ